MSKQRRRHAVEQLMQRTINLKAMYEKPETVKEFWNESHSGESIDIWKKFLCSTQLERLEHKICSLMIW